MSVCLVVSIGENYRICAGAQNARRMLIEMQNIVQNGGDFDVELLADVLETCLNGPNISQRGAILALADFIGSAMEGAPPELETWNPMERTTKNT